MERVIQCLQESIQEKQENPIAICVSIPLVMMIRDIIFIFFSLGMHSWNLRRVQVKQVS